MFSWERSDSLLRGRQLYVHLPLSSFIPTCLPSPSHVPTLFFPIQIHANKGPRMFRNEIMTLFWNMILFEIILLLRLYFYFVNILRHTYLFIFQVVCRHFIGLGNKTSFCLRAVVFNLVPTLFNVCDCVNKLGISIFIMYFCRNLRANLYIYIRLIFFFEHSTKFVFPLIRNPRGYVLWSKKLDLTFLIRVFIKLTYKSN